MSINAELKSRFSNHLSHTEVTCETDGMLPWQLWQEQLVDVF